MNKKFMKKVLTVMLAVAMVFSHNSFATMTASAEDISVKTVYVKNRNMTLCTGDTNKINYYTAPDNATNQEMDYSSSNEKVATVSKEGIVTAVAPGKATITVKATDGSNEKASVKVTVRNDLYIDETMLDSDHEVIILDKTFGHVYISNSVGDANLYFGNVTIKGNVTLEGNSDYTLSLYDSIAEDVDVVKPEEGLETEKNPTIFVTGNSSIDSVDAQANVTIRRAEEGSIDEVTLSPADALDMKASFDGYNGKLFVESVDEGKIMVDLKDSLVAEAIVKGDTEVGAIEFINSGDSEVESLILMDSAELTLEVPASNVMIDRFAKDAKLNVSELVGNLTNEGENTTINVLTSMVENMVMTGLNGKVNVAKDALVVMLDLSGEGTTLAGDGEVAEAYVNANNCAVDTLNTLVVIGEVEGTKVVGVDYSGNQTTTSKKPVKPKPKKKQQEIRSDVIITFDDKEVGTSYNMIGWDTNGVASIVELSEGNKVLEIKPSNYNTAAIIELTIPDGKTLGNYTHISYSVLWKSGDVGWKDVVVEAGESLSGQFANDSNTIIASYNRAAGPTTEFQKETIALNGNRSELSGTIQIALGISCEGVKDDVQTVYYIDDIELIPKNVPQVALDFDRLEENTTFNMIGWNPEDGTSKIVTINDSKALEIKPTNYNNAPVINITLPQGTKLGDYSKISCNVLWKSGDVTYKDLAIEADSSLDNAFNSEGNGRMVGAVGNGVSETNDDFIPYDIMLTGNMSELEGNIQIAVGISCAGDAGGEETTYYIKDITLIP